MLSIISPKPFWFSATFTTFFHTCSGAFITGFYPLPSTTGAPTHSFGTPIVEHGFIYAHPLIFIIRVVATRKINEIFNMITMLYVPAKYSTIDYCSMEEISD